MIVKVQKTIPIPKRTIISGPQGSGKSFLANQLANRYRSPVFTVSLDKEKVESLCNSNTDLIVVDGICPLGTEKLEKYIPHLKDNVDYIFVMQSYPRFSSAETYAYFDFIHTQNKTQSCE